MKRINALLLLVAGILVVHGPARAEYQPFQFQCVYDATTDGMITATSKLVPDEDDWTFFMKSDLKSQAEELEAVSAVVMGKNEKIPADTARIIDRFVKQLRIPRRPWYTTTEIVLFDQAFKMSFFKFNSEIGTLGIGVYTNAFGNEYFTECK